VAYGWGRGHTTHRCFDYGIAKMMLDIISATDEEAKLIDDSIVAFNRSKIVATQDPPITKNYVIKDQGEIIAGIKAFIYWGVLYIDVLFVAEGHRTQKIGSLLLSKVESEAQEMGATLVHLDTFDFQAKDFYIKAGYNIFGILEDCPKGHRRYYLSKIL